MTVLPDENRPEDPIEAALQRTAERLRNTPISSPVTQLRSSHTTNIRQALDIDVQNLTSLDKSNFPAYASRLALRHQEHIIAPQFVTAMLRLKDNRHDEEGNTMIRQLRDRANRNGFFIMNYTDDMMMERLMSPNYVITEAWGRHPDAGHAHHGTAIAAADCQCWLPDSVADPLEHVDLPDQPDDQIFGKAAEKLAVTLAHCGEVKDITAMASMNDLKLAGAARHEAFSYIRNVVNPARGDYPINFMAASIAELNGIILPDGTQFMLTDVGHLSGIKNDRSLIIHTSGRNKGNLAYTLVNRTVPVELNDQTYQIVVNWMYLISDLQKNH